MIQVPKPVVRSGGIRAGALALCLIAMGGCTDTGRLGPTEEAPTPHHSEASAAAAGIVFASFAMVPSQLNSVHTGIIRAPTPSMFLSYLSEVRAKGGRVVVVMVGDRHARNPDKTFNLTTWKSVVDRYRGINFTSYIADGTIVGHYVIDEPHFSSRWGGKIIPQSVVEEAAKYSKQLWPTLPTIVNAPANWLAASTITYTYLDAGWAMFRAGTSNSPASWAANQVTKAKKKGLGLFAGLNVLDGGDGSSGYHGNLQSKWAMSAAELKSYGSALLSQSYVCGFGMWTYSSAYYDRADVKSAMAELSTMAKNHASTSCKQ